MVFAHTFNIGTGELAIILLVGLLVFGPNKLPEVARRVGKGVRTLRKISNSFRDEVRDAMAEPARPSEPKEPVGSKPEPTGSGSAGSGSAGSGSVGSESVEPVGSESPGPEPTEPLQQSSHSSRQPRQSSQSQPAEQSTQPETTSDKVE